MSSTTTKILLVEDNPGDARLIQEMLAETDGAGFEIDWVPQLSAGLEKLGRSEIDLVLLDLGLPDSRGLDTFVRAYAYAPQIPFVVLTGLDDETLALSAVRQGAQDYLVKGQTDGGLLLRAIRYATERKRIEEELRLSNEELRREIEVRRAAEMAVEAERQRLYALLDGLPGLVYLKAPDFSLRFANRLFREVCGNWEGKKCFEALFKREQPCENCTQFRVLKTGEPSVKEATFPENNRTYQVYSYPFADVDGSSLVLTLGIDLTQRKQAEEALRESEQKYRLLVKAIPAVVFKGYADWSIEFFDKKVEELTGYSKEDFNSGRLKWSDIILEEDFEPAKQAFIQALKDDGAYLREYRLRTKDGRILWIQARGQIVFNTDGKINHVSGVFFDISERMAAREALRSTRERLQFLLSATPAVIYGCSPFEGYATNFVSDNVTALTGYQPQEFHAPNFWAEHIHPEDAPHVFAALPGFFERGYHTFEYRFRHKDGGYKWLHAEIRLVKDEAGKPLEVVGYWVDISDRKQAEETLKQSEARLAAAQRIARLGRWEWDIQKNESIWSEEIFRSLGLPPQPQGPTLAEYLSYIHPDDRERVKRAVDEALAGKPYSLDIRYLRRDGAVRHIHVDGEVTFDEAGRPVRMVGTNQDITERKKAEEEIKASEIRFRELFDNMSNGVAVFEAVDDGEDFIFKDFNRAAEWLDQVDRDEVLGHSVQELFPGVREFGLFDVFRRVWRTGQPEYFPAAFYKDERISGWRENYVYKLPSRELVAIFTDITERQQAEEALRQSEARLAKAQQLAHLGHWEWDLQSQEVLWSEEVYRIFGLDPERFTPSPEGIMNYVHPEEKERLSKCLKKALAGVKPYNLVSRLVRPDGSVRYVHAQAEAVFDESGRARRMLGTAQDITERRVAEMRLRESEERFRAIFEAAAMGIGLTDMKGRFLTVNKTFQRMLGYGEDELREKTCLNITHEMDQEKSRELFRELGSGPQRHFQTDKRFCRRDGQYFWGRVTVSLVKDFEGQPVYTIGMVEDITQEKQAEEKLQESEKRLRILASQLITAQEDERKRISQELHDELGQSLLVLKLQAGAIAKELGPEQRRLRQECREMLANFDKTVDNVRRLSRDLSPTIIEDLGLSAALHHLIGEFSKHYQIECRTQETNIDDLFPLATQIVIYRIVQESLTNIGKHSQANLLQISIDKNDHRGSFLIQDDGKGFDPAHQRGQRSGMGLAAMEERARMVGGTLSIWSQEGAGTKISLIIPYSAKPK